MLRDRLVTVKDIPAFHHNVDLILFSSPLGSLIPLWKKFWLNPTYHSGADVALRFSKWPPWRPAWILEWNCISNSESSCYSHVSHHLDSNYHFGYLSGTISAILYLHVSSMPPIKLQLKITFGLGDFVWRISRWPQSWISERKYVSNSESSCRPDASHQVSA